MTFASLMGMARLNRLLTALLALALGVLCAAQRLEPPFRWTAALENQDVRAGEAARILLTFKPDAGYHAYKIGQSGGPLGIEIKLLESRGLEAAGDPIAPEAKTKFDKGFKIDVGYYDQVTVFALPIRVAANAKGAIEARIEIKTQVCNDEGCDRPRTEENKVAIQVQPGESRVENIVASLDVPKQPDSSGDSAQAASSSGKQPGGASNSADPLKGGLLAIFGAGFLAGLLALLTPCVFPMVPVTISFFSKQDGSERKSYIQSALLYCFGIIASFTGIGVLVSAALGPNATQIIANNIWVNLALFVLFVILAASLFGVFELVLPTGFVTKISSSSGKAGKAFGPLLLGLTFALTSFTCTAPVVGGFLAAAATGDRLGPTVGMLGFSIALALPFFLLALSPRLMQSMPRAGSWMVTVKAFMGFLELAAALKFLSNIDLVLQWKIITKPVFLAIWSTLFIVAGLHLYGWIKLPHDSGGKIGMVRRAFAVLSAAAGIYCLLGINGKSMGVVAGLLPPSEYGLTTGGAARSGQNAGLVEWIKEDYPAALAESKATGKPLFIDFTGYT